MVERHLSLVGRENVVSVASCAHLPGATVNVVGSDNVILKLGEKQEGHRPTEPYRPPFR